MKKGKVYLVGAGPGDPGLITVRGLECIQIADVVIYDYLASRTFLNYAAGNAERIYVGKKGSDHTLPQDKINELIVSKANQGLTVTRLKGGDPYIFGRGGEEAEILVRENIPFEVVPGVTSAIAAPAYAGIPLTHRDFTSTVAFVTGHENPDKKESGIAWSSLARGIGTLVFLMGVKNLPHIVEQLTAHGMPVTTPVALVRWGTTPRQATVSGTLETIVAQVEAAGLKAPAVTVIGNVVQLRDALQWFEKKPLFGRRIVVTRAREQASDLVKSLSELGAECLECPTIKIMPTEDPEPLATAVKDIAAYDWLIFTSVNGVDFFFNQLFKSGRDVRALGHLSTAVIGPATAKRLFAFGLKSDILPADYRAESIVESFTDLDLKGKRILLPRAEEARAVLPAELRKMGAQVDEVVAYRTVMDSDGASALIDRLKEGTVDMITFTSSSTVKNLKAILPPENFSRLIAKTTIACIGPVTADTARALGFAVHLTADTYTIPGLCRAIEQHFNPAELLR